MNYLLLFELDVLLLFTYPSDVSKVLPSLCIKKSSMFHCILITACIERQTVAKK